MKNVMFKERLHFFTTFIWQQLYCLLAKIWVWMDDFGLFERCHYFYSKRTWIFLPPVHLNHTQRAPCHSDPRVEHHISLNLFLLLPSGTITLYLINVMQCEWKRRLWFIVWWYTEEDGLQISLWSFSFYYYYTIKVC